MGKKILYMYCDSMNEFLESNLVYNEKQRGFKIKIDSKKKKKICGSLIKLETARVSNDIHENNIMKVKKEKNGIFVQFNVQHPNFNLQKLMNHHAVSSKTLEFLFLLY